MLPPLLVLLLLAATPYVNYREGGGREAEYVLCSPGNSDTGVCQAFTLLGAGFVEVSNKASRDFVDLSNIADSKLIVNLSVAAVSGGVVVQCDTDQEFGSPTTLMSLGAPGSGVAYGAWSVLPDNECKTVGGVYLRLGMANGNGTESPQIRFVKLHLR